MEEKRRTALKNKLGSMLFKHKEGLKKDIAKKRALLEKEITLEIINITSLKGVRGVNIGAEEKRRTAVKDKVEESRRSTAKNKLTSMLFEQKERLKKDIIKKRNIIEKQLSMEIHKEVELIQQKKGFQRQLFIGGRGSRPTPRLPATPTISRPWRFSPPPAKRKKSKLAIEL